MSFSKILVRAVPASLALAVLALSGPPAIAKPKPMPDGAPPGNAARSESGKDAKDAKSGGSSESPYTEWGKATKDATRKDGLFATWTKRENYYWEIRKDQLNKPFLLNAHFAKGIGIAGQLGGLPIADGMCQFERHGDRVFLVLPQNRIVATGPDSSYQRAVDLSFGSSVTQSFKIESEKDSLLLVDMSQFFVSDGLDLSTRLRGATNKTFRFDKDRSTVVYQKSFPKNMEVEALLTYSPQDRDRLNLNTVTDPRYVPISVHYSFFALPETPMMPRLVDDRVGYFLESVKDMSRDGRDDFWYRYIDRWKLEKKDPSATLSEPKEPIVFYLENTIPVEWRPYVKAGVEEWNKAFEKAGFKNAILAKDEPTNDPDWDAEDARYSTLRWITSSEPSFGAIGPSETDPRSGQILNADILLEGNIITGYSNNYRRWVGPETVQEMMGLPPADLAKSAIDGKIGCMAALGMVQEGAFLGAAMQLEGLVPPGQPVPKEFIGAAVKSITMHEVGHTLGLRHNFKSSTAVSRAHLLDKSWVAENGTTGSIMDYDTPNVASNPSEQGYYFSPTIGTYDLWAIRYGYTPTSARTPEEDQQLMMPVARESSRPENAYGTDEDTYPADALDPRCNIYDLGDSPLAFSKDRVAYISRLWNDPNFESKLMKDNDSYVSLRRVMDTMLLQYTRGLSHARKYIGGQYASRAHKGDPGAEPPFVPVSAADQKSAMAFLSERAFSPKAFDVPPSLLAKIGRDQITDWGTNLFAYGRNDYPFVDRVLQIQTVSMNGLLDPALLARLREQETRGVETFRVQDVFSGLSNSIMSEIGIGGVANLTGLDGPMPRRELQRAYVDRLADMVANGNAPDDAEALARLHLSRISDQCQKDLAAVGTKSDTVRAHLMELRARARRALEASRDADAARAAGNTAAPVSTAQ